MLDKQLVLHTIQNTSFKERSIQESALTLVHLIGPYTDEAADLFRSEVDAANNAFKPVLLHLIDEIIHVTMHTSRAFINSFGRVILTIANNVV